MASDSLAEELFDNAEVVEVRILDSRKGDYTTYWAIPDDISAEEARKWSDPDTGILSVTTMYEAGESVTYLALSGNGVDIDTSVFD